jgi:acyl-coenzyme A synthetase/AMP-(fatty) acid ligase
MQLMPIGGRGELYIGGSGLAHGYLNRPELTAQRFILNPFDATGQTRLYQTGDEARFRPDGQLEFLGRADTQVKVRGFRIELEEIEVNLLRLPAIKEAAVIALEDKAGQKRLVAYYVPNTGLEAKLNTADLRRLLQQRLPEFMLPQLYVPMGALPLTPNQKVDRRALLALAQQTLL